MAPCKFPFKHLNKVYSYCTKEDDDKFWCATSVDDETNDMIAYGYCNDSCLNEDDPGTNPFPLNDTSPDANCDIVQFSFDDLEDQNYYQNFTKVWIFKKLFLLG